MAKVTGRDVIKVMEKNLGRRGNFVWNYYKQLPTGSAWCAGCVSYAMDKAGGKNLLYGGKPVFYVPYLQQWLKKNCTHVKMSNAQPGDIIIFTWDGNGYNSERGSRDHTGFVYKHTGSSRTVSTIEGNTSGGIVAKRTREARYIYGIYRPKYSKTSSIKPKPVKSKYKGKYPTKLVSRKTGTRTNIKRWQEFLCWWGVDVSKDGIFGADTAAKTKIFQKKNGLIADGEAGKKTIAKAKVVGKTEEH